MNPSIAAIIILAAGNSSRMGLPKQLLHVSGKTLLRRATETALAVNPDKVVPVLGFESERMRFELNDLPVHLVLNPKWQEGIASSIKEGISALSPSIESALIMLCDQPLVTSDLLLSLITCCTERKPIAATGYKSTSGVPACFRRSLFPELLQLSGDHGAKGIISKDPTRVMTIPFEAASTDLDTLVDYRTFNNSHV